MLILYRKKERRRVTRPRNSITGSSILDGSVTNSDLANESIQYFHLAPRLASLLDTIRSGLTTLLGATPLSSTPRDLNYSKPTPTSRTVSWSHPSNSQGSTPVDFTTLLTLRSGQTIYYIDSYELRYRIQGTNTWNTVVDISSITYTFSIPDTYQAYEVQVRGHNDAVGSSDWVILNIPADQTSDWYGNVTVALLSLSSDTDTEIHYTIFQGATSNSSVIATDNFGNSTQNTVVYGTPHQILYTQRTSTFIVRINEHNGGELGIAGSSTQAASSNATITFDEDEFVVTPTTLGLGVTIGIVITSN